MGYQPKLGGGAAGTSGGGGGGGDHLHHHPRLHSPRIAGAGSMTRRANSFKRGSVGEIELQISSPRSPRSDGIGSPPAESPEASSVYASGSGAGGGGLHHHQNQQHLRFRLFKRPVSGPGSGEVVLGLGIRERRKLGNLLFLAFCAVCLLLGVGKIWASGRFALPGDEKDADLQVWKQENLQANRDVTRMEIFLSLVRLLEPNCDSSGVAEIANNVNMPLGLVHQPVIPATGYIQ